MATSGNATFIGRRPYVPASFTPDVEPTISPIKIPSAVSATAPITIGIEPAAYDAILYGKIKPLFVGGIALMGGRIVEGPFYGGSEGEPKVSAIYYFAEAANPTGTRDITEFRVRGAAAAVDGSGYFTDPQFAGARVQYRTGTRTQSAFDVSIGRYGAGAIAYRQGIVVSLTDMPLRPFNGIIPFLSVRIEDSSFGDPLDGITFNDAIGVLLRYSRLSNSEFEVDLPGSMDGSIVANKSTLTEFLQNFRRLYVRWNITYTDKLKVIDPDDFTVDAEITRNNHIRGTMVFTKTDPLIIPRRKNYTYIDKDRDYEPNIVSAQEDIYPSPSTSSIEEEDIELPVITTAAQATSDVNISLYEELAVRSQMQADLNADLFVTEAGDAARFSNHDDINFVGRVSETQHDFRDWKVSITAGEVLNCGAEPDVDDPCEVPADGVIDINFLCPRYWVIGVDYSQAAVIGGTGTAVIVEDEGLLVDGLNGSYPRGIGPFLTKWAEMLTGLDGLTVVIEFKPFDALGEADVVGTLFMTRNTGDTRNFWAERNEGDLQVSAEAIGGFGNWNAASDELYVVDAVNRVAITFVPDPADEDGGKLAISTNGGEAFVAPSGTLFDSVDILELGHQYELDTRVSRYIRRITVYEPVADAALPGLSAVV